MRAVFRTILLSAVLLAFLLATPFPSPAFFEKTDAEKLAKVYELYRGYTEDFPGAPEISVARAAGLHQKDLAFFVDVRPANEREVSTLPGAVTAEEFLALPEKYRDKTALLYCTIGYRSGVLAQKLARKGMKVFNLKGGILAWTLEGRKVYGPGGKPVKRIHTYGWRWDYPPEGYESVY